MLNSNITCNAVTSDDISYQNLDSVMRNYVQLILSSFGILSNAKHIYICQNRTQWEYIYLSSSSFNKRSHLHAKYFDMATGCAVQNRKLPRVGSVIRVNKLNQNKKFLQQIQLIRPSFQRHFNVISSYKSVDT